MARTNVRGALVGLALAILMLAGPAWAAGPGFERTPDLWSQVRAWVANLWEENGVEGVLERAAEALDRVDLGKPVEQGSGIDPDG